MKSFCLLIFVLIMSSAPFAFGCKKNASDAFEPQNGMPSGRFMGRCLKTKQRRNFYVLNEKEAAERGFIGATETGPVIANISHGGKFAIAKIDLADIESLTFQMERFNPKWIAAHTQLRFNFKRPLVLYDQLNPSQVVGRINALIFSVEAVPMEGGPNFDLPKGLVDYFALSKRMASLDQKYYENVIKEKNTVNQFRINFSALETQLFFQQILQDHFNPRFGAEFHETYNTVCRNCTNKLFESVDKFLNLHRGLTLRALTALPIISIENLKMRGLIDPNDYQLPDFDAEQGVGTCRASVQN